MKQFSADSALAWAQDLCSRAEYASGEIRERLIRKGLSATDTDRIIRQLVNERFIDDRRFADAFVGEKVEYARWGRQKIATALFAKRIPREIIKEALDGISPETYTGALVSLLKQKLGAMRCQPTQISYADKVKIYRFAASRGFSPSETAEALKRLSES